jgi:transposase-like protein
MAKNNLANPIFSGEAAARQWLEAARWPSGPICPKCGSARVYPTKKTGVYRCAACTCRKDFTVMTGTVMERSHAKLAQWAAAFHLAASSKKGLSAHQLHRELGLRSRVSSRFSKGACAAFISTARRSICTVTLRNLISDRSMSLILRVLYAGAANDERKTNDGQHNMPEMRFAQL